EVALERQHEEVCEQSHMLLVVGRDAQRPRVSGRAQVNRQPCPTDPQLDLPYSCEILVHLAAFGNAELLLEATCVLGDEVPNALGRSVLAGGGPHSPRTRLDSRRGGRRPAASPVVRTRCKQKSRQQFLLQLLTGFEISMARICPCDQPSARS